MSLFARVVYFFSTCFALSIAAASACAETVHFMGLKAEVPGHWRVEQPGSNMRLLQYSVPGEEGGEGADRYECSEGVHEWGVL